MFWENFIGYIVSFAAGAFVAWILITLFFMSPALFVVVFGLTMSALLAWMDT